MLNSVFANDFRWNRLQEPAHPSGKPADLMRLLAALDTGWIIVNPVQLTPCEDAFGGEIFEITLHHVPTQGILQLRLTRQASVEHFLCEENCVVTRGKTLHQ